MPKSVLPILFPKSCVFLLGTVDSTCSSRLPWILLIHTTELDPQGKAKPGVICVLIKPFVRSSIQSWCRSGAFPIGPLPVIFLTWNTRGKIEQVSKYGVICGKNSRWGTKIVRQWRYYLSTFIAIYSDLSNQRMGYTLVKLLSVHAWQWLLGTECPLLC